MNVPGKFLHKWIVAFGFLASTSPAFAGIGLTYQGRILKPDGSSLDSSSVRFTIEIKSYNDCLLYQETQTVNLSASSGVFSLNIGSAPAPQIQNYVGTSLSSVFTNRGSFTGLSGCTGGTYSPNADDDRKIVVSFEDLTLPSPTIETIPSQNISYVPFAIETYQISGYTSRNLLRVNDGNIAPLTVANFNELMNLINGSSTQYVTSANNGVTSITFSAGDFTGGTITSTGSVALKDITTGATKGSATKVPQITYDNKGRITSVAEVDISGVPASGAAGGDLSGTYPNPTIGAGKVDETKIADNSITSAKIKDGEIVNADISATAAIADTKLATITTSGKVANSATTGTAANTPDTLVLRDASGNFAANNITANNITANQVNTNETYATDLYIRNASNKTVKFNLDPAAAANLSIVWPTNTASAGKVLSNDGNGNLSWVSSSSGSVTSVTAGTGLNVGAGPGGMITSTGTLNVNVGTGANQILQLNGSSQIPGVDGSLILNLNPANLSGAVPIAKGGTGQTTALSAFNALSPLSAKGDLLTRDGTNNIRLPADAADFKYLRTNSGTASGLEYGDVTAVDIASLVSTGIVKRTGGGTFTTLGVQAPLIDNGTNIGITTGTGLTTSGGILAVDVGTTANKIPQLDGSGKLDTAVLPAGTSTQWKNSGADIYFNTGRVGIGTNTPTNALDVGGTIVSYTGSIMSYSTGGTGGSVTAFLNNNTPASGTIMGTFGLGDGNASNVKIQSIATENHVFNTAYGTAMLISTTPNGSKNPVERMRIDHNGQVGIGTTNPGYTLDVNGSINATSINIGGTAVTPGNYVDLSSNQNAIAGNKTFTGAVTASGAGTSLSVTNNMTVGGTTTSAGYSSSNNGNSGAPAYTFSNDPDTGLYSSGNNANDINFSTGGTRAMTINNSGYVGIGTASPSFSLDVQSSASFQARLLHSSNNQYDGAALMMTRTRGTLASNSAVTSGDTLGGFYFRAHDGSGTGTTNSTIEVSAGENHSGTNRGTYMIFETTTNGSATRTEKMRIHSNGNVGIGTNSPGYKLDVNGSFNATSINIGGVAFNPGAYVDTSSNQVAIAGNKTFTGSVTAGGAGTGLSVTNNMSVGGVTTSGGFASSSLGTAASPAFTFSTDTNTGIFSPAADTWAVSTNGTEKLRVTSTGNLGIGTTTPTATVDIDGGITRVKGDSGFGVTPSSGKGLELGYDTTTNFGLLASYDRTGAQYKGLYLDASPLTLNGLSNANVGIGNLSPQALLHVGNSTNKFALFAFNNPATSPASNLGFIIGNNFSGFAGETNFWNGYEAASTSFEFRQKTGASTSLSLMTLLANGKVGIGTSAPSEKLEVAGNIKATEFLYTSDARLKKDVVTLPDALTKVLQLRGVNFNWKANDQKTVGFIAQEVEKVYPELVRTDANSGYKAVQYGNLVAVLVEALKQEHQERVKSEIRCEGQVKQVARSVASVSSAAEERLNALEKENVELKARLERLEKALLNK